METHNSLGYMTLMPDQKTSRYRFRVSDVVQVPLRGTMLRLKLLEGDPSPDALEAGKTIRLVGPGGRTASAQVRSLAVTTGSAAKETLHQYRQVDVVVAPESSSDGLPVGIGWFVVGD